MEYVHIYQNHLLTCCLYFYSCLNFGNGIFLLVFTPVPPRNVCRVLLTSPSWPCSSCTCWLPYLVTSPFMVMCSKINRFSHFSDDVKGKWMIHLYPDSICIFQLSIWVCRPAISQRASVWFRCCGVGAVTHLQSCGPSGCPDSLRASGCVGGRHSHRPCGSFPSKIFHHAFKSTQKIPII